ncbi:MAG: hypothetical protein ABI693_30665, partial [Bryobacteraceae bacterium]
LPTSAPTPHPDEVAVVLRHLAHELRQPLSTIESIAFYLEMVLPATEHKALAQISKLQDLVEQANSTLTDAIHYMQAVQPRPVAVDLTNLVDRCFAEDFFPRSRDYRLELSAGLPAVRLDLLQCEHLLRTLFSAVSMVSQCGEPVVVRTCGDEHEVQLEVCCAAGPQACLKLQFDPCLSSNSGLAVSCARRIAEVHGGRLHVQCDESFVSLRVTLPPA